jgi:hypothetical protein
MSEFDKIKKAIKKGEEEIEEVFTGEKSGEDEADVKAASAVPAAGESGSSAAEPSKQERQGVKEKKNGGGDQDRDRLYLKFFDDSSVAPVLLDDDTELQIQASAGKQSISATAKVKTEEESRGQYVSLDSFLKSVPQEIAEKKREITLLATVALTGGATVGCARYAPAQVAYQMKLILKDEEYRLAETCCNCIPVPVTKLADTCIIRFRAWDASKVDFIEHAEAFRSDVKWTVTAVQTALPPAPSTSSTSSNAASTTPAAGATPAFQPWTASVASVEGAGEIFGVPPNQLYQIVAEAQQGYCICEGQAMQYRHICCDREIEIEHFFKPCGVRPVRTAVFVPQSCPVDRWGRGRSVNVGGRDLPIGENGILNIPEILEGAVHTLSAPNVTFAPPTLDLTKDAPTVTTITVTEQPVLASGRTVQGQFVDQEGRPFVRRPISVLLPDGSEVLMETDSNGRFVVPAGSLVCAREDGVGLATDPVMIY